MTDHRLDVFFSSFMDGFLNSSMFYSLFIIWECYDQCHLYLCSVQTVVNIPKVNSSLSIALSGQTGGYIVRFIDRSRDSTADVAEI